LEALAETGILHTGRSKHLEEFRDQDFDLVVTVCDPDAQECPAWLGKGKRLQHAYADPALTNELNDFRKICKAMESEIPTILFEYEMEMK
jgi:arsenate reductase